jgi:very-short-patch-repair endonuclease
MGAAGRAWNRWASATGKSVVLARRYRFPSTEWVRSVAEQVDLPAAAVQCLAQRAGRDPNEFRAAWRTKTPADRERFWSSLVPHADDDLLRAMAALAVDQGPKRAVAASLSDLGDRIVPLILHLAPSALWPAVLFTAASRDDFPAAGAEAVRWATTTPAVPVAVAVPAGVWAEFLTAAPESRAKALLREGEVTIPGLDPATVERTLTEAGASGSAPAVLAKVGADAALVESAVGALRATAAPPATQEADDRARSAAERFLFTFLESLTETAGRFELNAQLDFPFGPRPAEVDLLCRSPRIVIELDGYFHFLAADGYRRDRAKDWELQRRGYLVLRFLAEDVIPQLEVIRDRILEALTVTPSGGRP